MTLEHCMIDTETFGVGNSAGLVQIGAVAFDLDQASSPLWTVAEWTVSLQSSLLLGGEVDSSTVAFWRKAPLGAQASWPTDSDWTGATGAEGRDLEDVRGTPWWDEPTMINGVMISRSEVLEGLWRLGDYPRDIAAFLGVGITTVRQKAERLGLPSHGHRGGTPKKHIDLSPVDW